jgi:gliding motility-associated-like protein
MLIRSFMKKIIFLAIITLFSAKAFSQTPVCATGDCSDGGLFSMQYCIVTPLCGGFEGDITANITTAMPNCTGCVEILLTGTDNPNTRSANVNIAAGAATASFSNIPEGFYVLTTKTPIVPTPPVGSTKTSYVCSKLIQINAVDTLSIIGNVTPDPCPVVSPFQGAISVTASGGTAPYTYDWADIAGTNNTQNRTGLAPGSYTVTVRDVNNCSKTQTFTITEQKPTVNLSATPNPICRTGFPPNVTVTWTATPGAGWTPHATPYSWNGGPFGTANTQSVVVSAFGNYTQTVRFRDINGCISDPVTVIVPADRIPTGTVSPLTATVCPGNVVDLVGAITQCSAIGATPCQFSFDNGATYQTAGDNDSGFVVNAPQTVTVRIRNQTGCVSNPITIQLDTLGKPRITYTATPNPVCPNNASNVTVNFICNPANCAGYTYSFNGGPSTSVPGSATVSFMSPVVTATTSFPLQVVSTCTLDTNITIQVFPNNTNINAPDTIVCANNVGTFGPVTLTATGFSSITDWTPIPGTQTTTSVTVIPSVNTTYTVTGTDLNGCPRTASQDVVSLAQPVVTTPSPLDHCEGTTTLLTGSGAASYEWVSTTFTSLSPNNPFGVTPTTNTTYHVIGTDANGCKDSATVNVMVRAKPTGTANATPSTICAGNHSMIAITINPAFTAHLTEGYAFTDALVFGPSSSSSTSGIGNGDPLTTTTTYNTYIKDQYNCISDAIPVTVTVTPFTASASGSAQCSYSLGGTGSVTVTGGTPTFEYSMDVAGGPFIPFGTAGNTQSLTGLAAGPHIIYIRDNGNTCSTSDTFNVASPAELIIDTTSHSDVICFGDNDGVINAIVSGGTPNYQYFVNGVSQGAASAATSAAYNSLTPGFYELVVVDNNTCRDTIGPIEVRQPTSALVAPTVVPDPACFGTTDGGLEITVGASGGWGGPYMYTFGPTPVFPLSVGAPVSNLAPGTYTVTTTDSKGCTLGAQPYIVTEYTEIVIDATVVSPDCNQPNGNMTVNSASGSLFPYTFEVNGISYNPGTLIGSLGPDSTITVHVDCTAGCSIDSAFLIRNVARAMPILHVTPPLCPGGDNATIVIDSMRAKNTSVPPYTIDIFKKGSPNVTVGSVNLASANSSGSLISLSAGEYIMNLSDGAGCNDYPVDSFIVFTPPSSFAVTRATYNAGEPDSNYSKIQIQDPAPFTASAVATASDIHESTGTAVIYNFTGGTPLINGNGQAQYQVSIDNGVSFAYVTQKDTLGGSKYMSFGNLAPGPHTVYIIDENGCRDTILIQVPGKFFIPNLVTPNEDDANDVFEVISLPDNSELRLYNRWGDRVFESSNYDNKYDFKGLSDGVYYYDLEFNTGTRFKGWVQVLR